MTRKPPAPAAPKRSRRCSPRAASSSTSWSTKGLLIIEGLIKGLDKPTALIGVAEKGYATLVLKAHATPGHSSMPPRDTAIGMMSAALARLEDHRLPMQIRGTVAEMFDTLAPEMSGFNRVALSNLWLFKPLLLREFEKSGPTEATVAPPRR